jgi:hypothetical protein
MFSFPIGCPKLRELSLSFNSLENMDDLSFKDVGTSLGEETNFAPFTNNIFFEKPFSCRESGNQFRPPHEDFSGVCPEAAAEAALAVTGQQ